MASFAGPSRFKVACPIDLECQWTEEIDILLVDGLKNKDYLSVRMVLSDEEKKRMNEVVRSHLNEAHRDQGIVEWLK